MATKSTTGWRERARAWGRDAVRGAFNRLGFNITRITPPSTVKQYFNSGALSPRQENDPALYDAFYGDAAAVEAYYQSERLGFYREVLAQLREAGLDLAGADVLDVGCGIGHLLASLRAEFRPASVSGCDFSGSAVEVSRRTFPGVNFFQHDVLLPLPDRYGVIFCTEVLEHVENYPAAFATLRGALRPGGSLVLTVPNGRVDSLIEHVNFWSPESWAALLGREFPLARITNRLILDQKVNFSIVRSVGGPLERE